MENGQEAEQKLRQSPFLGSVVFIEFLLAATAPLMSSRQQFSWISRVFRSLALERSSAANIIGTLL